MHAYTASTLSRPAKPECTCAESRHSTHLGLFRVLNFPFQIETQNTQVTCMVSCCQGYEQHFGQISFPGQFLRVFQPLSPQWARAHCLWPSQGKHHWPIQGSTADQTVTALTVTRQIRQGDQSTTDVQLNKHDLDSHIANTRLFTQNTQPPTLT